MADTKQAYVNATIDFSFRWNDEPYTTAGLVIKAKDAQSFYLIEFPAVGQSYRAEEFWVVVSRVSAESGGWHRALHSEPVPGVSSSPSLWHDVRVVLAGSLLQISVDGTPTTPLHIDADDGSFAGQAGFIGLVGHCNLPSSICQSVFRGLKVEGEPVPKSWDSAAAATPSSPSRLIEAATVGSSCSPLVKLPGGDLLFTAGAMLRSSDQGRSFKAVPAGNAENKTYYGQGAPVSDGSALKVYNIENVAGSRYEISYATAELPSSGPLQLSAPKVVGSGPLGRWNTSTPAKTPPFGPSSRAVAPFGLNISGAWALTLRNGTLLLFSTANAKDTLTDMGYHVIQTFDKAGPHGANVVFRSTDGVSFSEPIDIDGRDDSSGGVEGNKSMPMWQKEYIAYSAKHLS